MLTFLFGGLVALFLTAVICVIWQICTAPIGHETKHGFETIADGAPIPTEEIEGVEESDYVDSPRGNLPVRG